MQDEKATEKKMDASGIDAGANNEGAQELKPEEPRTASVLSESNEVSIRGGEKVTAAGCSESAASKFSRASVYTPSVLVIVSLLVVLVSVAGWFMY